MAQAKRPKTGGRKAGVPNKDKAKILAMIEATGCKHPIIGLAEVAMALHAQGELKDAAGAYKELAQYVTPKRKAIEVTGEDGGPLEHSMEIIFKPVADD